jgi:hypothetical protein
LRAPSEGCLLASFANTFTQGEDKFMTSSLIASKRASPCQLARVNF